MIIHAGRSAEKCLATSRTSWPRSAASSPAIPIAYLALSPAISRITEREGGDKLNALIAAFVKSQPNLIFIDTSKVSLGPDGQPQPDLFVADKLRASAKQATSASSKS